MIRVSNTNIQISIITLEPLKEKLKQKQTVKVSDTTMLKNVNR
jgi:hypothetical protein